LAVFLFGSERNATEESKFVFLFEDGEIYDIDDLKDFKFHFLNTFSCRLPSYFNRTTENNKKIYFYKKPLKINNLDKIDFKPLFTSYSKFNNSMNIASCYNSIYYCHKSLQETNVFGLLRIKSNENLPRFLFAYDSEEFTKEEVIYLIHYIFVSR
jgi:hypothetical protein